MSSLVTAAVVGGAYLGYSVYNGEEQKRIAKNTAESQRKEQERQLRLAQANDKKADAEADRDANLARQRTLATGMLGRKGTILTGGASAVGSTAGSGSNSGNILLGR